MERKKEPFLVGYSRRMLAKGIFLAALMSFFYTLGVGWVITLYFLAYILVHEGGHLLFLEAFGLRICAFYLHPLGAVVNVFDEIESYREEGLIGLIGPAMGLSFAVVLLGSYGLTQWLPFLALAIFFALNDLLNLLPAEPMDGGLVFRSLVFSLPPFWTALFTGLGYLVSFSLAIFLLIETYTLTLGSVINELASMMKIAPSQLSAVTYSLWLGLVVGLLYAWLVWLIKKYSEERKKTRIKLSGKEILVHLGLYLAVIMADLLIIAVGFQLITANPWGLLDLPKLWQPVF